MGSRTPAIEERERQIREELGTAVVSMHEDPLALDKLAARFATVERERDANIKAHGKWMRKHAHLAHALIGHVEKCERLKHELRRVEKALYDSYRKPHLAALIAQATIGSRIRREEDQRASG